MLRRVWDTLARLSESKIQENKDWNRISGILDLSSSATLGEQDPRKQGLKLAEDNSTKYRSLLGEQDPRKQGLKQLYWALYLQSVFSESKIQENKDWNSASVLAAALSSSRRARSKKTRIETDLFSALESGSFPRRARSKKTRIETQPSSDSAPVMGTRRARSKKTRIETMARIQQNCGVQPRRARSKKTRIETSGSSHRSICIWSRRARSKKTRIETIKSTWQ